MIEVNGISKIYPKEIMALNNISFNIEQGSIAGIIGRNGAGKSTLFKILCGLLTDYEGDSKIFGQKSSISLSHRISYLPEVRGLDSRMYVLDQLIELVMYKGFSRKQAKEAVERWLRIFSLYERRFGKISSLSKGNQQKIQMIAAVAANPEILILDEPFSGLDLITIDYFWDIMLKLREQGCTILFSTHDLNDNLHYCNQLLFLHEGILRQNGPLAELQNRFDLVLELQNALVRQERLEQLAGRRNVKFKNGTYEIRLTDKSVAHAIFDDLEEKYCEKFYVRKMSIPEIFREISGGQNE